MTTYSKKSLLMVVTTISLSLVIPGCSLFDKSNKKSSVKSAMIDTNTDQDENDNSQAIVTIDGKPLITQDRLEREKQNLIETNPQIKQMIAMMPAGALDKNLAEGLANQEVMGLYIKNKGIDQSTAYKTELSRAMKAIPQALNMQFFVNEITASITDGDIKSFYDASKDSMPQFILSLGGVAAQGISCATQADAQALLEKVKAMNGDMQKAAQEMNVSDKFEDFKQVNNQSMNIDPQLREKILAITVFPSTTIINADNAFWVVKATAKEPVKYRDLESIKNDVRQYLGQRKAQEEIARLREEYNIVIDDSYFGPAANAMQPSLDDMPLDEEDAIDMTLDEQSEQAQNKNNGQMRTTSAA